jgi:uncharacterized membrane protein
MPAATSTVPGQSIPSGEGAAVHPPAPLTSRAMERSDLSRIVAFTDGVMAVAITLLVLNLDVPQVNDTAELDDQLVDLLPSLGAYVLSFALVGRYWVIHHNLFDRLEGFDGGLRVLNLVFLALIALVPFATDLMDQYNEESLAAAVFGATLGLAALANWCMHAHALRAGLVKEAHRDATHAHSPVSAAFTAIFLLSVPLAFVSPHLAQALWIATILLRYPLRRVAGLGADSSP